MTGTAMAMMPHIAKLMSLSIRRMNVPPKTSHRPFPPATFPSGRRLTVCCRRDQCDNGWTPST